MATYVNDLRLKEIATGDESGTWGTSVNTQYELIGEAMGAGTEAVADASTHTITMADGATDGFRCTFLRLTGGGQACTVTLAPNTVSHTWIIRNATSYALTFTQGSGANVIIAAGQAKIVSTDGAGSGAIVYECLEDLELGGTLTVGIDDTGQDVKFYGATSGKSLLWDESADSLIVTGSTSQQGTLTVGVDDTGFDVKLFGATSGKYWLWDESADGVVQQGTLTVGVDDTGYDVKLFGATSGNYMLWDESADDLKLVGAAGLTVAGDIDVDGTANLDIVDIDGAVDMATTLTLAGNADFNGDLDVDGTSNLDAVDVDGAVNFAADVTYADGADIITASAGTNNFRAGVNAGNSIASGGNYNVCVGDQAGTAITTGDDNTFVGFQAGDALTEGLGNVAIGLNCLGGDTKGGRNVAIGHAALINQNFTSATNAFNIAIGYSAGSAIQTGTHNTLIGGECHDNLTTGDLNVALGYNNGPSAIGVDSEIVIGCHVTGGGANTVRIGQLSVSATLGLDGSDTSWAAASDSRLKKDVADSTVGLSFINALRPVTYKWNAKNAVANSLPQYDADSSDPVFGEGKAHHGFVAQEVKTVIDAHSDVANGHNILHEDPDGTQLMAPGNLVPMLVKAIQEQSALITALTDRVTTLEG
jgi:hypothetical protein